MRCQFDFISDSNRCIIVQVHQDDFLLNVKLQLFALTAKQPAFHQLRSVEQLGYITVLLQRYVVFFPTEFSLADVCLFFGTKSSLFLGMISVFLECNLSFNLQLKYGHNFYPFFISQVLSTGLHVLCCAWQDPKHIDSRVEEFLKMFESKLYEMADDEFKVSSVKQFTHVSFITLQSQPFDLLLALRTVKLRTAYV